MSLFPRFDQEKNSKNKAVLPKKLEIQNLPQLTLPKNKTEFAPNKFTNLELNDKNILNQLSLFLAELKINVNIYGELDSNEENIYNLSIHNYPGNIGYISNNALENIITLYIDLTNLTDFTSNNDDLLKTFKDFARNFPFRIKQKEYESHGRHNLEIKIHSNSPKIPKEKIPALLPIVRVDIAKYRELYYIFDNFPDMEEKRSNLQDLHPLILGLWAEHLQNTGQNELSIKLDNSFNELAKCIISGGLEQSLDSVLLGLEEFLKNQNMTSGDPFYDNISFKVIKHIQDNFGQNGQSIK